MLFSEYITGDMPIKDLSPRDNNSSGRIIKNLRICGSGLYKYHVSEAPIMGITIPGDYKDEWFNVYRPAEMLASNKDLYARIPIITGHHIRVTRENAKQLAVGMVGDSVIAETASDGETYLYTTGTIIAGDGIEAYEKYGELSVGYDPILKWQPGTYKGQAYQVVMTGLEEVNHLLICQTARGGHQCRVMDSLDITTTSNNKFKLIFNNKPLAQGNGGKQMGMFSKIFGAKPMTGDARVVEVLLDSIKAGADPATQVAAVRSMMGDSKDETFTGYLDELAGITSDDDKKIVAKAIDVVKGYYRDHLAGDEAKKEDVKNDEPKKDSDGKTSDEPKKEGEAGDADKDVKKDEPKQNGDSLTKDDVAKMIGDAIAKAFQDRDAEAAKKAAEEKAKNEPKVNGDELARLSATMTGDNAKIGVTSDSVMNEIFG